MSPGPAPEQREGGGVKVALVCGAFRPRLDGVADYTARLARRLPSEGVEPAIHDVAGLPRPPEADLVHVQWAPTAYRGGLPRLTNDVPLAVTLHEMEDLERGGLQLASRAAAIVCTGEEAAAVLRAELPGATVEVVPIGPNVDVGRADGPGGARDHAGTGYPLAVFFGFVHPVKGIPYLLDALVTVRVRHPHLRLAIVGGFESLALPGEEAATYRAEVGEQIDARGLRDAVTVTGWQAEEVVSGILRRADLAVLPFTAGVSAKSGALLTVLAHGLPVVATRPPGGVERPGVRFVPVRDAMALAEAITRLLDDPAEGERLSRGARASVPEDPWGQIARAHRELYDAVLRGRLPVPIEHLGADVPRSVHSGTKLGVRELGRRP